MERMNKLPLFWKLNLTSLLKSGFSIPFSPGCIGLWVGLVSPFCCPFCFSLRRSFLSLQGKECVFTTLSTRYKAISYGLTNPSIFNYLRYFLTKWPMFSLILFTNISIVWRVKCICQVHVLDKIHLLLVINRK